MLLNNITTECFLVLFRSKGPNNIAIITAKIIKNNYVTLEKVMCCFIKYYGKPHAPPQLALRPLPPPSFITLAGSI